MHIGRAFMRKIFFILILFIIFISLCSSATAATPPIHIESLLDQHGAIILFVDPATGDILYANSAAATFYGYSREQLQTMNVTNISTLTKEQTQAKIQAALIDKRNYFICEHQLANDDIRTVEVFSYPVMLGDKQMPFSIMHDVTDKKILQEKEQRLTMAIYIAGGCVIFVMLMAHFVIGKSHKKIRNSKKETENYTKLIETFINADSNLVYLKDENLKYVFANTAFQEFHKKTISEIIGKDDYELADTEFALKRRQTDLDVLNKNSLINDEIVWQDRIYRTVKFPVKMLNGSYGIGAYVRDVTKQREQARHQEQMNHRNKILVDVLSQSFKDKQEQLDYVLHRALELSDSKFGYIYYYDENTKEFTLNSWTNGVMNECSITNPMTKYILEKTGLWGEAVRQRKPIVVNDFQMPHPLKKGYPQGHVQLTRFISVPIFAEGKIVAVVGLANKISAYDDTDITNTILLMNGTWHAVQRKDTEEQLSYERNLYRQTLISIGDGVMVVDKSGYIEMLNDVASKLTEWTNEEARGKHYKEVFLLSHEDASISINDPIEQALRTNSIQVLDSNIILSSRYGKKCYLEDSAAPILNDEGDSVGAVLVFRDITGKREQRMKIEYLSFHDQLTGLYNRRFFEEELARIDTQRNLPISIIMGDINGLKLINDIFGHLQGDKLLQRIADILRRSCRADDISARWGGDEFVMLLPKTSLEEAHGIACRIKEEFSKVKIKALWGSISIGVAGKTIESENVDEVLVTAEERMYVEKTLERENYQHEMKTLIDTLHAVSNDERLHAQKVSTLCEQLGRVLGLPEDDIRKLREAAYLHDIGKIVWYLNSKEHDNEDKSEIKNHPVIGYRILNCFDHTLDLSELVLSHHEKWDGSGYPRGLQANEIPLLGRIITVVNEFDHISREGKLVAAIKTLEKMAGSILDPKIVEAFVNMLLAE